MFWRLTLLTATAVMVAACGTTSPGAVVVKPSPTLSSDDQQLLAQLRAVGYQIYETPLTSGSYIFEGGYFLYDGHTFELNYNGLIIDEWKAVDWNPASGKCPDSDPRFEWNCSYLLSTPGGHELFAGATGGLAGNPPYLGDIYFKLGATELHMKGATGHVPTQQDVVVLADAMQPAQPESIVALNQKATDYLASLHKTAAGRVDFKTYLPAQGIARFTLDKKLYENVIDPTHPYLYLHFGRPAQGNEAFEFSSYEFKDSVRLSAGHCGVINPELTVQGGGACTFVFNTDRGVAVYSSFNTTRFDLPATRVVVGLSMSIDKISQAEMTQFIDSFAEVSPQSIG